jgi:hypothetical protein
VPDDDPTAPFAEQPAEGLDGLVLDDAFVRAGAYEPPARTRVAIARYGGRQTSWRHAGGLTDPARRGERAPATSMPRPGAPASARRSSFRRLRLPTLTPAVRDRLPLAVAIVVVAIAAFFMFR